MAAWQKFRVELKGEDPVEVQTNAWDWANATVDPNKPMDMTFRIVHAALLRTGVEVPRDYRGFMEVLAGMPEAVDGDGTGPLDPTDATPSGG